MAKSDDPREEGGEVEKACVACHVLWPEDALNQVNGLCPDCIEAGVEA